MLTPANLLTTAIFWIFAALAVVSALLTITRKNAVYSAFCLIICFFSLAVLYVLLNAQFIAAVQVIVYAGAIMVLFLFVIMLLQSGRVPGEDSFSFQKVFGWVFGIILALQTAFMLLAAKLAPLSPDASSLDAAAKELGSRQVGNTETVAYFLFTKYIYPFEVVSVLLLIAIIGAVVIGKKKKTKE